MFELQLHSMHLGDFSTTILEKSQGVGNFCSTPNGGVVRIAGSEISGKQPQLTGLVISARNVKASSPTKVNPPLFFFFSSNLFRVIEKQVFTLNSLVLNENSSTSRAGMRGLKVKGIWLCLVVYTRCFWIDRATLCFSHLSLSHPFTGLFLLSFCSFYPLYLSSTHSPFVFPRLRACYSSGSCATNENYFSERNKADVCSHHFGT